MKAFGCGYGAGFDGLVMDRSRQSEVNYLDVILFGNENVFRLDVTMDDPP